jgi:hypothetical protein
MMIILLRRISLLIIENKVIYGDFSAKSIPFRDMSNLFCLIIVDIVINRWSSKAFNNECGHVR